MTNPMIEKKVAEIFRNIDEMRNPEVVRQALTDMFEMGQTDEAIARTKKDMDAYKEGAANMKKRILELIEQHDPRGEQANPHYWGKTLRAAIKSIHSQ